MIPAIGGDADPRWRLDPAYRRSCDLIMSNDEIAANRAEWLDQRRRDPETGAWRLTASELASVIGVAPELHEDGSPYALYREKITGESGFTGSDRTDFGLFCEPFAADRFARAHDELQLGDGGFYVSGEHPWLGATFDRIAYDVLATGPGEESYVPLAPVQIKTWAQAARWQWGPAGSGEMPSHIRVQCLIEMTVLGADRVYVPVLWLPGSRVDVYEIERDAKARDQITALIAAGQEFIGLLEAETPPEVDWSTATTSALKRQYDRYEDRDVRIPVALAARYRAARVAEAAAKRRKQQAVNEIRARMGNAARAAAMDADGQVRKVCSRSGGPRAGYTVDPIDWVEQFSVGPWGNGTGTRERT